MVSSLAATLSEVFYCWHIYFFHVLFKNHADCPLAKKAKEDLRFRADFEKLWEDLIAKSDMAVFLADEDPLEYLFKWINSFST